MKRLLLVLAEFVALSVPLTWAWLTWGKALYLELLVGLLETLGAAPVRHGMGGVSLRFVSHVPFAVLMLITPELSARRRLVGWAIGASLIVASHLLLLFLVDAAFASGRRVVPSILPLVLLVDGLPFLIWLVLARDFLRSLVPGLRDALSR